MRRPRLSPAPRSSALLWDKDLKLPALRAHKSGGVGWSLEYLQCRLVSPEPKSYGIISIQFKEKPKLFPPHPLKSNT